MLLYNKSIFLGGFIMKLSASLENYLETMLFLEDNSNIRITDVANKMNVSKASVNKAVNLLKENGLLSHDHYGQISFTDEGLAHAKSIAKKHDILVKFFADVLNIDSEIAEEEACEVEHILSSETVNAIEKLCTVFTKK